MKNTISDGKDSFPLVMVGGVLDANKRWDIGKEVIKCISKDYPGTVAIRPKVSMFYCSCHVNLELFVCMCSGHCCFSLQLCFHFQVFGPAFIGWSSYASQHMVGLL